MLLVNGEILKLENPDTETGKWVKEQIDKITKSGKVYTLKATMRPQMLALDGGGVHVDHRYHSVPTVTSFINPVTQVGETWQYVEGASSITHDKHGDRVVRRSSPWLISTAGTAFDPRTRAEEIFFISQVSRSLKRRKIVLENKELEAKESAEKELLEAQVKIMIYSPDSIISKEKSGSEDVMRRIAAAFGVENADIVDFNILKINLWDTVRGSQARYTQTQMGYKEFIDIANREGDSEKRSTIMLAMQRGFVNLEDNTWYVNLKGGGRQHLTSVPREKVSSAVDFLMKFLLNKEFESFYKLVEEIIESPAQNIILDATPKSGLGFQELKAKVRDELGWKWKDLQSKKQKELEVIYAQKIKP